MTTKELLAEYDKATKNNFGTERALWHLLKANEKHITGLIEEDPSGNWLHKAHRQIDVTPNGHSDMAIWLLLNNAPIFWAMLEERRNGL